MLLFNAIFISVITIPSYYLLHHGMFMMVMLVLFIFTLASSLEQGTTPAVLVENFPITARYTGISFSYNVANGLLGGSIRHERCEPGAGALRDSGPSPISFLREYC